MLWVPPNPSPWPASNPAAVVVKNCHKPSQHLPEDPAESRRYSLTGFSPIHRDFLSPGIRYIRNIEELETQNSYIEVLTPRVSELLVVLCYRKFYQTNTLPATIPNKVNISLQFLRR